MAEEATYLVQKQSAFVWCVSVVCVCTCGVVWCGVVWCGVVWCVCVCVCVKLPLEYPENLLAMKVMTLSKNSANIIVKL